jgi:pimeloyl-ACP methyl ester carboxylesterase
MGNPIVFIHGSGGSAANWQFQTGYFGPQQTIAIDLPGHGQRPDTLPAEARVQDYTRAVHDIITHELRLDHPIIAGHSLGGAIALSMGLEYGQELGGLILVGTGARLRVLPKILEDARRASLITYRDWAACNIFDIMTRLNEIHLPTLIICGADDRMTPIKYSQYMHDRIQGSTLCIIPDAGHDVMREQPEAVNHAIKEWLKQRSASTAM